MADLVWLDDLDLYGSELDDPQAEIEQEVLHILGEVKGSNIDDPDRGEGLFDLLSGPGIDTGALARRLTSTLNRIDGVESAVVEIAETSPGTYEVEVSLRPDDELKIEVRNGTPVRIY